MSEPPLHVESDGVHAHPHRTGHRGADIFIALAAISISLISLFVAIEHGKTERDLVAANSWPFLRYVTERDGLAPDPEILILRIANAGVGPARVKRFVMRYGGVVMHDRTQFLQACCGVPADADAARQISLGLENENSPVVIYPARENVTFLAWKRSGRHSEVWDALNKARQRLSFDVCYCSVLGQCWTTDLKDTTDPRAVARCPAPNGDDYRG